MKKVLNLSLGSDKRDFENSFIFLDKEIYVKRIGLNGDIEKFMSFANNTRDFDAVAIGGINSTYCFGDKIWFLSQYCKLTSGFNIPIYDGQWIKKYYEPNSLQKIIASDPSILHKKWLVMSALDRKGSYDYLQKNNINVILGDIYAAFMIPFFPSHSFFKVCANVMMPIFSKMSIENFYPYKKSDKTNNGKALLKFDVILSETNFLLHKNINNLCSQTIIFSRASDKDKNDYALKGCKVYSLLPGEILSANIIEAIVATTIGLHNSHHDYMFEAIKNIKIVT